MNQEPAPPAPITEHHIAVRRTARYHCIGEPGDAIREVWIVIHGYAQLARHFIRPFRELASSERLIVAPEALSRSYDGVIDTASHAQAHVGAIWMTREDRLAEIDDYVGYLDQLHSTIVAGCNHPNLIVRVLGFSQGTATASRWFALGSSRIDHLILWGGALAADLDMASSRDRFSGARFTAVAGEEDKVFTPSEARGQGERLASLGIVQETICFVGGHVIDRETLMLLPDLH
jgi:predicted esterase